MLTKNPDVAVICGGLRPGRSLAEGFIPWFVPSRPRLHRSPSALVWCAGANLVVRTAALRAVSGSDEVLGPGAPLKAGEEADLVYRLLRAGHPVLEVPEPCVIRYGLRTCGLPDRNPSLSLSADCDDGLGDAQHAFPEHRGIRKVVAHVGDREQVDPEHHVDRVRAAMNATIRERPALCNQRLLTGGQELHAGKQEVGLDREVAIGRLNPVMCGERAHTPGEVQAPRVAPNVLDRGVAEGQVEGADVRDAAGVGPDRGQPRLISVFIRRS